MHAQVAETFENTYQNIFLVGDSAHRFPPAGGFGMNTGLQDAHNIAWKLALVTKGIVGRKLLKSYTRERKKIADENTSLSLRNYQKSIEAAKKRDKYRFATCPRLAPMPCLLVSRRKTVIFLRGRSVHRL